MTEINQQVMQVFCEMRDALLDLNAKLTSAPIAPGIPPSAQRPVMFALPYPTDAIRFWQVTVPVIPSQIMTWNEKRIALLIFNTGMANILLNKTQQVSAANGFPVPGGAAIGIDNYIGDIWAVAIAPVLVGIIEMEAG